MRNFKRFAIVLFAIALCMTACTQTSTVDHPPPTDTAAAETTDPAVSEQATEPDATESYSYFVNPKSIGPVYWEAARAGAERVAEDLGVEVIFNAPTEADSAKQINMIDDMLTRQVNGIAVSPNDAQAVAAIFTQARNEGVQVVTWDSDAPDTDRTYYVGAADDKSVGAELAEMLAEEIGGEGEIAIMVAGLGAQNQIDKIDGATELLEEKYPDITVVTTVASNDDQQVAFANAQNIIQTYPDLKGIVAFAGGDTPAAAEAVSQAGKIGEIKVTGICVPSVAQQYIESGAMRQVLIWDPGMLAYASVYVMHEMARGNPIHDTLEIPTVGTVTIDGSNLFIGTVIIDASNVGDYDF